MSGGILCHSLARDSLLIFLTRELVLTRMDTPMRSPPPLMPLEEGILETLEMMETAEESPLAATMIVMKTINSFLLVMRRMKLKGLASFA